MNLRFFIIVILILDSISLKSQKYANEFLFLGAGARAFGMGNSVITSVLDATAGYWNPSNLNLLKNDINLSLMHNSYFGGISNYNFASVAIKPKDSLAICFSFLRFAVDDIPNTLELIDQNGNIDYSKIKSFSISDNCLIISLAKEFLYPFKLGMNTKIIKRIVGSFADATGFGFDIAFSYFFEKFTFSIVLRDATSTFTYWTYNYNEFESVFIKTQNKIPSEGWEITYPRLSYGFSYKYILKQKFNLIVETNFDLTTDGKRNTLIATKLFSLDPKIGLELSYLDVLFLRIGSYNFQKVFNDKLEKVFNFQPTIGLGLKFKNIEIDYAYTDIANTSIALYSHVISINFSLASSRLNNLLYFKN